MASARPKFNAIIYPVWPAGPANSLHPDPNPDCSAPYICISVYLAVKCIAFARCPPMTSPPVSLKLNEHAATDIQYSYSIFLEISSQQRFRIRSISASRGGPREPKVLPSVNNKLYSKFIYHFAEPQRQTHRSLHPYVSFRHTLTSQTRVYDFYRPLGLMAS